MKKLLREEKRLERLNHHPLEKRRKDELIMRRLKRLAVFGKAKTILFYLPIHGEVNLQALLTRNNGGRRYALPRVSKGGLEIFLTEKPQDLEKGSFKIMEPKTHLAKAAPSELDLVLVPGIVFAEDGHRIGYGKGFYDRLLKKVKCPKIGIAYEFQMVENIPAERHDTPMDMIVTEKKTRKIRKP